MMIQFRSNEEAFAVVCRVFHRLKQKDRSLGRKKNMKRIGVLDFELTGSRAAKILIETNVREERLRLREVGGGFIRRAGQPPRQRDPVHGRII